MSHFDHKCLYYMFSIRPCLEDGDSDPFNTNTKYCHHDEAHGDYLFKDEWVELLIANMKSGVLTKSIWKSNFDNKTKLDITPLEL